MESRIIAARAILCDSATLVQHNYNRALQNTSDPDNLSANWRSQWTRSRPKAASCITL